MVLLLNYFKPLNHFKERTINYRGAYLIKKQKRTGPYMNLEQMKARLIEIEETIDTTITVCTTRQELYLMSEYEDLLDDYLYTLGVSL